MPVIVELPANPRNALKFANVPNANGWVPILKLPVVDIFTLPATSSLAVGAATPTPMRFAAWTIMELFTQVAAKNFAMRPAAPALMQGGGGCEPDDVLIVVPAKLELPFADCTAVWLAITKA